MQKKTVTMTNYDKWHNVNMSELLMKVTKKFQN